MPEYLPEILIFTKTDNGGTDQVWFYDMKADGFSLDDKRTPVTENDIPDIIERFKNLDKEADRKRTDQSFMVPKKDIVENDYDLSINKYKEIEYTPVGISANIRNHGQYPGAGAGDWKEMDELERLLGIIEERMADSKIRVCRDDDMKLNEICEVYSGYALKAFNDAEDGFPVIKIGNISWMEH